MLKKKGLILLVIIICLILCTSSCFRPSPITLEELCNGELVDVDKILLRDGNTGKYKELNDKEKIKEIVNILAQAEVLLQRQEVEEIGWSIGYSFIAGNRGVLYITLKGNKRLDLFGESMEKGKFGIYEEIVKEGSNSKMVKAISLINRHLKDKDWK